MPKEKKTPDPIKKSLDDSGEGYILIRMKNTSILKSDQKEGDDAVIQTNMVENVFLITILKLAAMLQQPPAPPTKP